jgi:hypothetical protein
MAGYGRAYERESKLKGDRAPRVMTCGDCGVEVGATELLCKDCRGTLPEAEIPQETLFRASR